MLPPSTLEISLAANMLWKVVVRGKEKGAETGVLHAGIRGMIWSLGLLLRALWTARNKQEGCSLSSMVMDNPETAVSVPQAFL